MMLCYGGVGFLVGGILLSCGTVPSRQIWQIWVGDIVYEPLLERTWCMDISLRNTFVH